MMIHSLRKFERELIPVKIQPSKLMTLTVIVFIGMNVIDFLNITARAQFIEPSYDFSEGFDERWGLKVRKAMSTSSRFDNLQIAKSLSQSLNEPEIPIQLVGEMCLQIDALLAKNIDGYTYRIDALKRYMCLTPESSAWAMEKVLQVMLERLRAKPEEHTKLDSELGRLGILLGNIYGSFGQYENALKRLTQAKQHIERATVKRDQNLEDLILFTRYMIQLDGVRERLEGKLKSDPENQEYNQKMAELLAFYLDRPEDALTEYGGAVRGTDLHDKIKLMTLNPRNISTDDALMMADFFRGLSLKDKNNPGFLIKSQMYYSSFFAQSTSDHPGFRKAKLANNMVMAILQKQNVVKFTNDALTIPLESRAVDVLSFKPKALEGSWKKLDRSIEARHPKGGLYQFPLNMSGSFRADLLLELQDTDTAIALVFPVAQKQVGLLLNTKNQRGSFVSAIALLDGIVAPNHDATYLQSARVTRGRHHVAVIVETVESESRISVYLDGESLISWQGEGSRLGNIKAIAFKPNMQFGFGLSSGNASSVIHAMRLIPIDGSIDIARKENAKEREIAMVPAQPTTGQEDYSAMDLDNNFIKSNGKVYAVIRSVNPKHAIYGEWKRTDDGIASGSAAWNLLQLPYRISNGGYICHFDVIVGRHTTPAIVSLPVPDSSDTYRINLLLGPVCRLLTRDGADQVFSVQNIGNKRSLKIAVIPIKSQLRVQVMMNDILILNWLGTADQLENNGMFSLLASNAVGIGSMSSRMLISRASLQSISQAKLSGTFPKNSITLGNQLNKLSKTKATLQGRWDDVGGAFRTKGSNANQLKLSPELRGSYELDLFVERLDLGSEIRIALPVGVIHRHVIVTSDRAGFIEDDGSTVGLPFDGKPGPLKMKIIVTQGVDEFTLVAFLNGKQLCSVKRKIKSVPSDPKWSIAPARQVILGALKEVIFYGAHIKMSNKKR